MNTEDELLLEMIKGKLSGSRLKRIKAIIPFLKKYEGHDELIKELKKMIDNYAYDKKGHMDAAIIKEADEAFLKARRYLKADNLEKAIEQLGLIITVPGFYYDEENKKVCFENEYELFCLKKEDPLLKTSPINFAGISYLLGYCMVEANEAKGAIYHLENAIALNPFKARAYLEVMNIKLATFTNVNKGKPFSKEQIDDVLADLDRLYPYIYHPSHLAAYFRKLGFILVEEKRYEAAIACYQLSMELMGNRDTISLGDLECIDELMGEKLRFSKKEILSVLESESINYHISLDRYLSLKEYLNDEKADPKTKEELQEKLDLFHEVLGEYKVRIVSVQFNPRIDKTYDYLCEINNIYPGDRVEVPGWEGKGKATVKDVRMVEISRLPLPVEKYKKVIRLVKK